MSKQSSVGDLGLDGSWQWWTNSGALDRDSVPRAMFLNTEGPGQPCSHLSGPVSRVGCVGMDLCVCMHAVARDTSGSSFEHDLSQ